MPNLQWSEIKLRANQFVKNWKELAPKAREEADAHSFQIEFFHIFDISARQVGHFEQRVEKQHGRRGYIDFFWKGVIMTEMKTPGKDMEAAYRQAKEYSDTFLKNEPEKLPHIILICDFINFDYYNMDNGGEKQSFKLEELPEKVELFKYLIDLKDNEYKTISDVDIKAAEKMGELHDALKENKYTGHDLEMYLVRLLFCLFADDTGIFGEKGAFYNYIINNTNESGSDLAMHIETIFLMLNTNEEERQDLQKEQYKLFPYVNGGLFEERLKPASFNSKMRKTLLDCCQLDWSKIKPEIFGAMFQSVKDKDKRRALGEHYTSETNILKVITPLFLDDLWNEFEKIRKSKATGREHKILEFHTKLKRLKFFDPACGCGNFLIVTYRELRKLENEVISEYQQAQYSLEVKDFLIQVNVDQFYGIEIEEFPARIAQTAMWLMDHLMNNETSAKFGMYIKRLPLTVSPSIVIGNALTLDWEEIVPKDELSYILGNPPFLGASIMTKEQKFEVEDVFEGIDNYGILDYVTCWYKKAAKYIKDTEIEVAFVSTNSICQGEQVPVLWSNLMNWHNVKINFAHQTFKWQNEAKGKAAVYCIIVGFGLKDRKNKKLFIYETVKSNPVEKDVKIINGYLVDAPIIFIEKRKEPICNVSQMTKGSAPTDDGNLLLTQEEKDELIKKNPKLEKNIRPFTGAKEYLHNIPRYCIWLKDVSPSKYSNSDEIIKRLAKVNAFRTKSNRTATLKFANFPSLFGEIRQPDSDYLIIPRVSSENRDYIPVGFIDKNTIASDSATILPNATLYEFGIITSNMHMAWMRYVCGRLKSDYRYSNTLVYNNFPWPKPTDKQKTEIEKLAQEILDVRAKYSDSTLADLYEPLTMPADLLKAHQKLDKAVETAYGKSFNNDEERVSYLFNLYQEMTKELFEEEPKKIGKKKK